MPVIWLVAAVIVMGAPGAAAQDVMVDRSTIEAWVFQQNGGSGQARQRLQAEVELKISAAERDFGLSDDQKKRLELAGSGDIKRFYDRLDHVHAQIETMRVNQNNFNDAYQLTVPLQNDLQEGLFDDDSLFDKVLRGVLSPSQIEAKAEAERERRQAAAKVYVRAYVSALQHTIPLTAKQRDRLLEWLFEATVHDEFRGPYGAMLVQYRMSALSDDRLAEVFDEPQITAIKQLTRNARGFEAMLRGQGLLKDEPVEP